MATKWNTVDNWQQTTLGEICNMRAGVVFPRMLQGKRSGKYPFAKVSDMNLPENAICIWSANNYVDETDLSRLKGQPFPAGCTVFAKIGEGLKQNRLRFIVGPTIIDNNMMGAIPITERVDPRFFFYALSQFDFGKLAEGTALPYLTVEVLSTLSLHLPPLSNQRAIAHILSTIDNKIELNRQMNETLEAIARAIFKSWFVDFDPVRAKMEGRLPIGMDAATATLFSSAFQDSPLGKIPKGWKVGTLGEIAENVRQSVKSSEIDSDELYIGLEHMPRRSIALSEWQTADKIGSNKYRFRKGEILFGKLRPYFHKVGVAPIEGICSTDILVVQPIDSEWFGIVLGLVSSDEFIAYTNAYSAGTRMPRTNWKDMSRYEIALPPVEVSQKYTEFIRPFIERIIENIHQSHTLFQIRDALLPKLLSGEIRLDDVEERLEVKDGGTS